MFQSAAELGAEIGAAEAARRARFEPLVEVMQHKGDSECLLARRHHGRGLRLREAALRQLPRALSRCSAPTRRSATPVRARGAEARARARSEARRESVPLRPRREHRHPPRRARASSSERGYPGHGGAGAAGGRRAARSACPTRSSSTRAGSRCSGRRRTRATRCSPRCSAARPTARAARAPCVRFFGGWSLPDRPVRARPTSWRRGYAEGVPMGGELAAQPAQARARASPCRRSRIRAAPRRPACRSSASRS